MKDLKGQKFGNLIVLELDNERNHNGQIKWICKCDCGTVCSKVSQQLCSGHTKSCGCLFKKTRKEAPLKHGQAVDGKVSSEYSVWISIKDRCYNINHKRYKDWGGRGIKMCDRWLNSFENFFEDMGKRPSKNHSIDRIDNNLGYSKENCKWSTRKEQQNNKRNNRWIEYKGENKTLAQWGEYFNTIAQNVYEMLKRHDFEYVYNFYTNKIKSINGAME